MFRNTWFVLFFWVLVFWLCFWSDCLILLINSIYIFSFIHTIRYYICSFPASLSLSLPFVFYTDSLSIPVFSRKVLVFPSNHSPSEPPTLSLVSSSCMLCLASSAPMPILNSLCSVCLLHSLCSVCLLHALCSICLLHSLCSVCLLHSLCSVCLLHALCSICFLHSLCFICSSQPFWSMCLFFTIPPEQSALHSPTLLLFKAPLMTLFPPV